MCYIKTVPKMRRFWKGGIKMQANLLKGKIIAAGYTQNTLAKELNMSKNTLSAKINGRVAFNCDEVVQLCSLLAIDDNNEKAHIFLQ